MYTKDFMPRVSFAGAWDIGTSSTVAQEFGNVTTLAGVGDLGVKASFTDTVDLGAGKCLEDILKITRSFLYDRDRDTTRDFRTGASPADVWRIGAAMSLTSS